MSLILIVDDEESVRDELTGYIEDQGHEVLTAEDGHEGLQSAKNFAPDVILVDSMMPVMGGLELMEKLRQARETHELPLILMTDHETPKEKQSAQSLGVTTFRSRSPNKIFNFASSGLSSPAALSLRSCGISLALRPPRMTKTLNWTRRVPRRQLLLLLSPNTRKSPTRRSKRSRQRRVGQ